MVDHSGGTDSVIQFYAERFASLVGATITSVSGIEDDDGRVWPSLHVVSADGSRLRVDVGTDPEGNGPGFLFIDAEG